MTEAQFTAQVIQLARLNGWLAHHCRPALTDRGWRTPIQGTAGFVDLVLVKNGRLIFAELKAAKGKLRLQQITWLEQLRVIDARIEVYIWRPADMERIISVLTSVREARTLST